MIWAAEMTVSKAPLSVSFQVVPMSSKRQTHNSPSVTTFPGLGRFCTAFDAELNLHLPRLGSAERLVAAVFILIFLSPKPVVLQCRRGRLHSKITV